MSDLGRPDLAHAALKLEIAARLEQKLRSGEKLNGDEWELRASAALDIDEMAMIADALRKVCFLDARDVKIDVLFAEQKQGEARQWRAVTDYQAAILRDADGAPKEPEAARQLWLARSQSKRLVFYLVTYYRRCGLSRAAALRAGAAQLRRTVESVKREYARRSPK